MKLDLDLLKTRRVSAAGTAGDDNSSPAAKHMSQPYLVQVWLEYAYYSMHHPVLLWLPTKLAEWIAHNMQDDLGFLDGHLLSSC